jgi:putative sigma-54 modulation protein
MKIDIFTKNIDIDEPLRVFVDEKIGGLEKYLQDMGEVSARVEIGKPSQHHNKGPVFFAEANLNVGGHTLRGEKTHEDLRAAIVDVKEQLKIQITKWKEK